MTESPTSVDLIFRSAGERTSFVSEAFAVEQVRPRNTFHVEDVKPQAASFLETLNQPVDADYIITVDADCLIGEDLRPFLQFNKAPLVNAIVHDRFLGPLQAGVRIYRRDLFEAMKEAARHDGISSRLHPEYQLARDVRKALNLAQVSKRLFILHGYLQSWEDVFTKTAVRTLKLIKEAQEEQLDHLLHPSHQQPIWHIARAGARYALHQADDPRFIPDETFFLEELPAAAAAFLSEYGMPAQQDLSLDEVGRIIEREQELMRPGRTTPKIFGIGLERTGTRTLNRALNMLGFDTIYFPHDPVTTGQVLSGSAPEDVLEFYDGLAHMMAIPYMEELMARWPTCRFILTERPREEWLASLKRHWQEDENAGANGARQERINLHKLKAHLRSQVYGCTSFNERALVQAWIRHQENVESLFQMHPDRLLRINFFEGDGWPELCGFLQKEIPRKPFPQKGRRKGIRDRRHGAVPPRGRRRFRRAGPGT